MDSSGRTPSGIFAGNSYSLGEFDQCIGIRHEISSNNEFNGQYCLMDVAMNISEIYSGKFNMFSTYIIDIETEEIASGTQRRLPR